MKKIIISLFVAFTVLTPQFIPLEINSHSVQAIAEQVVYNPKSHKMHKPTCASAKRCKTCITIDKSQAEKQGGIPCKRCMK